ncbi:MAG: alcohol dehydrogenase catalytic domain-containing protein [Anaerolineales bacterium]|nr:alcohol dehydrogenase catalytic domain-containing protein [Anaerolineales bacterium]
MQSLRLHDIGDLRLHEEEKPAPADGEALLRVTAVGICGSDIHWFADGGTGAASFSEPFVLGHEFAAVVESGPLTGTRVAVEPHVACGHCVQCEQGNPNLCPNHYFAGQAPQNGALRQFMCWPEAFMFPIPDTISDEAGALLEPLGVAIHTVDLGKLRTGMRVGVYGCGPIGLMVVRLAKLSGALEIFATDKLPHRLAAAQRMGATAVFPANDTAAIPEVDVAFEVAGDQGAVDTAVETCKPGGRVILCGIPSDDTTSFKASTARRKGLTIKIVRRMKHTYPRAIALAAAGLIDLDALVSHCYSLAEGAEAFQVAAARKGLKVVIKP